MAVNVTWISHRGFKEQAVENTREAFQAAVLHGFSSLETDLRLTRDGHIVLHHDVTLARLGDLDVPISELTRAELQQVVLREFGASGSIMFLDQFIREFPGCTWTFDVKPEGGTETIRALYAWSKTEGVFDWVVAQGKFVLWNRDHEDLLTALFPNVPCYAREAECWRAGLWALLHLPKLSGFKRNRVYSLPPRLGPISLYSKPLIERFHVQGAKVLAFLPSSELDVRAALDAGVDEILTNGVPLHL